MQVNRYLIAIVLVIGVSIAAHLGKFHVTLGAHPFWATKAVLIGTPIGLAFALGLVRILGREKWLSAVFAVLMIGAFWVAYSGKIQFAASYAEDIAAGQRWFFGWIGFCAAFSGLMAALVMIRRD